MNFGRMPTAETTAPCAPALVSPEDKALLDTKRPLFEWGASTKDVVEYRLQVTSGDLNQQPGT